MMIRSLIVIVCAFVFTTTSIQSSDAQAWGDYSPDALFGETAPSQITRWIKLADQGMAQRILSSDAYHDDFRFRAAPVKPSRNWTLPIVDVRPAKNVSRPSPRAAEANSPPRVAQTASGKPNPPAFSWVWQSSSDLAVRHSALDDPFGQLSLDFIPRPLPSSYKPLHANPSQANQAQAKRLELKLVKVNPATEKRLDGQDISIVDVRKTKGASNALDSQTRSPANNTRYVTRKSSTPVVDWVWQSSSDLAVRHCDLDDPFGALSLDFIPRPLPTKANILKLELVKVQSVQQKRKLATGRKDYWSYYADCDRWNVVFAVPNAQLPPAVKDAQKVVANTDEDQKNAQIALAIQDLADQIAHRWESAISLYRTISTRLLTSRQ
jgi:hypothetical protein